MEIPAWLFISFWAVISITSLHLGFLSLDKTELSHSVSPVVMFLFKHSLAVSSCFSSCYALKFRAQSTYSVRSDYVLLVYVFFSFISPGTIEGMFIWQVLKAVFACLVYFLSKLKIFLSMILRVPALLFLSVMRFCWKILPVISVVIVTILLYHLPYSSILSFIGSDAAVTRLCFTLSEIIFSCIFTWLTSPCLWLPICLIIYYFVSFLWFACVDSYNFVLACKNNFNEVKIPSGILLMLEISLSSILSIIGSNAAVTRLGFTLSDIIFSCIFTWHTSPCLWLPICFIIFYFVSFLWFACVYSYKFVLACKNNFNEVKTRSGILLMLEISLFFASATKRDFSPILALSISHLICVSWAALPRVGDNSIVSGEPFLDGLFRIAARFTAVKVKEVLSKLKEHKAKKFIEFAVGTAGAILFQNFFRITSFSEVAVFLYFAVMWLANLVLLGFCCDFGVFNFLLANVVVGCTVGQFGLHGATWIAFGAALLLYALRLKLESFSVAYGEGQRIRLSLLGDVPPDRSLIVYL